MVVRRLCVLCKTLSLSGIQDWMLLVAVGLLVVVDLTIIITYMVVVGTMDGLGARETSFAENPQDTQGVSYIHIEVSLELQYYVAKRLTIMTTMSVVLVFLAISHNA